MPQANITGGGTCHSPVEDGMISIEIATRDQDIGTHVAKCDPAKVSKASVCRARVKDHTGAHTTVSDTAHRVGATSIELAQRQQDTGTDDIRNSAEDGAAATRQTRRECHAGANSAEHQASKTVRTAFANFRHVNRDVGALIAGSDAPVSIVRAREGEIAK